MSPTETDTDTVTALLARIEAAASVDPAALSTAALAAKVLERQQLLDLVQRIEPSHLARHERADLRQHLEALRTNCTALVAAVQARLERLDQSRARLVSARGAMRGYRPLMKRKSRTVDRAV